MVPYRVGDCRDFLGPEGAALITPSGGTRASMSPDGLWCRLLRRWRWSLAIAICVLPAVSILVASEIGHRELARGYAHSAQAIWLGARLHELSARLAEAETGQRSYLLTL